MLGRKLGIAADDLSVSRILESVDSEDAERLARRSSELKRLLKEVAARTRRVNVLLRHAAETNRVLLHALLGETAPLRPYRPDGNPAPASGLSHFSKEL
jgi:hypothetical protein